MRPVLRTQPALLLPLLLVVAWLLLGLATDSALMADNVEQEVWAHSFEWGYHKHPPLPTWLLIGAQQLVGAHWWLTPVLAALCLAVALTATYGLTAELAGPQVARLTALLWGLHLGLTWRANLYNHNTVLLALSALLAWLAWRTLRAPSWTGWTLLGATAAAALLAKYQSLVLLLLLLGLATAQGAWGEPRSRWGLLWSAALCLALVSPHLHWLTTHDWGPLRHAGKHVPQELAWAQLTHTLGFAAQQLRVFWPAWFGVVLLIWLARRRHRPGLAGLSRHDTQARRWVLALVAGPPALILALGLAGVHLQNHWGLLTFQFASLGLALLLRRHSRVRVARLAVLALALHGVLALALVQGAYQQHQAWNGRVDRYFPAQALADRALRDWRAVTACPLHYTVGWSFEAGLLSAYSGQHPQVFESGSIGASPWIDEARLARDGAIYVAYTREQLPANAARYGSLHLTHTPEPPMGETLHWAVVAPLATCAP